jgi:hypothetical protein
MVERSEDQVAAIDPLNSKFGIIDGLWLNWRPGGALRWKVKTIGWEGQRVLCGKLPPSRL